MNRRRTRGMCWATLALAACGAPDDREFGTLEQAATVCPGANTVQGIDVSSFQGNVNWGQVFSSGRRFGYAKATQGTYYQDAFFAGNWSGMKNAGVIRGAYHFLDATIAGKTQADYFLAFVGSIGAGDLPPQLDWECGSASCGNAGTASNAQQIQAAQDFIDEIKAKTGKTTIIYTYPSYWSGLGEPSQFSAYPLWWANPGVSCPDIYPPWSNWTIWQYGSPNVPGVSGACDVDEFNGSLAQLQQLANSEGLPPISQVSGNDAITLVNWPDKHSELFVKSPSGTESHSWSNTSGGAWSALAALDTSAECGSAAAFWGDPWLYPELFSPLSNASTGHLWWASGAWNKYQALGGSKLSHLSTVVWPDGHTEVFALGSDHALWHNYWNVSATNWSGWSSMGGNLDTGASPIVWGNDTVELFATDSSGNVWHTWFSGAGPWASWTNMGSGMASRPAPVRWPDGHVEIFVVGKDSQLYHSDFNSTSGWPAFSVLSKGDLIMGEPSAIMNGTTAEVFTRDLNGAVVHLWGNSSGYNTFTPLGNQVSQSDPFGWLLAAGGAAVYAVDSSGSLVVTQRTTSTWSAWTNIGGSVDACAPALPGPDAGTPDAGQEHDGGGSPEDSGVAADAGGSKKDGGSMTEEDAGRPGEDSGNLAEDSGSVVIDSGNPGEDSGSVGLDSGNLDEDGGGTTPITTGCGCGAGGASPSLTWVLMALGTLHRRRLSRRRRKG
jgi:lysozyme